LDIVNLKKNPPITMKIQISITAKKIENIDLKKRVIRLTFSRNR
jgi:hypothetical protein